MLFSKSRKAGRASGPMGAAEMLAELSQGRMACRLCGQLSPHGLSVVPLGLVPCDCGNDRCVAPRKMGSFFLYEFIAEGGMGAVYRAVSAEYPGETFAVKLVTDHGRGDGLVEAALFNEAKVSRTFAGHPHIVQAVECGDDAGDMYLATEFIDGDRLDALVEQHGAMAPLAALALVRELLRVDKFIWRAGFLYRDLKPENILIQEDKCKLIDFGLCVSLNDATNTAEAMIDGAPHFMPPERLAGEEEGVYSETYSLGMILYYCLTGQTLFPAGQQDAQEIAERYLSGDRSTFALRAVGGVTPQLIHLVAKAIALQIPGRFQSFDRLDRELAACERSMTP